MDTFTAQDHLEIPTIKCGDLLDIWHEYVCVAGIFRNIRATIEQTQPSSNTHARTHFSILTLFTHSSHTNETRVRAHIANIFTYI